MFEIQAYWLAKTILTLELGVERNVGLNEINKVHNPPDQKRFSFQEGRKWVSLKLTDRKKFISWAKCRQTSDCSNPSTSGKKLLSPPFELVVGLQTKTRK